MTLVSVVIPTRNRAEYVREAVASALGQSHPAVEVVVVDDGSTDTTPEVLSSVAGKDNRLRVIRHAEGGGAPRARNAGARAAGGTVLAFLDDDCLFHPEKIRRQLRYLDEEHGVVCCQQIIRDLEGGWVVEGAAGAGPMSLERLPNVGTNTILVRRELFQEVGGFDELLPRLQDFELLLRLSRVTSFAFIPEPLVKGVMLAGGITLTPGPLAQAAQRIVQEHRFHLAPRDRSLLHYILGKFLLVDGLTNLGRRYMIQALRLDPMTPRNWAGVAAGLLGPAPARLIRGWRRRRRSHFGKDPWQEMERDP